MKKKTKPLGIAWDGVTLYPRSRTWIPKGMTGAAWRARNVAKRRAKLIAKLGGKCEVCGHTSSLEFHHITERTWIARKTSRWRRMVLYEREALNGEIVLACKWCNQSYGKPEGDLTESGDSV